MVRVVAPLPPSLRSSAKAPADLGGESGSSPIPTPSSPEFPKLVEDPLKLPPRGMESGGGEETRLERERREGNWLPALSLPPEPFKTPPQRIPAKRRRGMRVVIWPGAKRSGAIII